VVRRRRYSPSVEAVPTPQLETERLLLRGWRDGDLDAHAAMSADVEVQRFLQGPLNRSQSWREMAFHVGHWALRGYGNWVVERKHDGEFLGRAGLWNPEGWFGVEVGWKFARRAWGHGYATEAGQAAIDWGFATLDLDQIISVISPENEASMRVAKRLGMTRLRDDDLNGHPVVIMALAGPRDH
jgi:RimJ/RimL family protein N-acetyltransferase